ncbi:unnamed protein product [Camellia sinensis]
MKAVGVVKASCEEIFELVMSMDTTQCEWDCSFQYGVYVELFCSWEHENCDPQPGFVRAHVESGGFNISPLKPQNGRPRTQVQHIMQIDLKGWGVGYISSFQQHCLLQMLNSVAGANTANELPERLIGAVRVSHIELSSAIVPKLDQDPSD